VSRHLTPRGDHDDDVGRRLDRWAVALESAVDTLNKALEEIKDAQKGEEDGRGERGFGGGGGA
jgi:hypothetical protein